jgi:hypothetical protein
MAPHNNISSFSWNDHDADDLLVDDRIASLVNKYSTGRTSSTSSTRRSSGGGGSESSLDYYHDNSSGSHNNIDGSSSNHLLTSTSTADIFPGDKYVQRRSSAKARKEKKEKRKSSRRNSNKHDQAAPPPQGEPAASSASYRRSSSFVQTSSSLVQDDDEENNRPASSTTTRASVSPSYFSDSTTNDLLSYAESKYIRPPKPSSVEQENLVTHMEDPLAAGGELFEDELDDVTIRGENGLGRSLSSSKSSNKKNDVVVKRRWCCRRGPKYYRNYYCCSAATLACCLVVVGIVLTVLYGVVMGGFSPKKNAVHYQTVPPASNTLKLICAEGMDLPPGQNQPTDPIFVPQACQDACHAAECCWNPSYDKECTLESQINCPGYQYPCKVLGDDAGYDADFAAASSQAAPEFFMTVPTAPATLKTLCVPNPGTTNEVTDVCASVCDSARCCWDLATTKSCSADSVQNCGPYKDYCSLLNDNNGGGADDNSSSSSSSSKIPPAPDGLNVYCNAESMEEISFNICQDKCSGPVECCWKDGIESCSDTEDVCQDYKACSILNQLSASASASASNSNNDNTFQLTPAPASSSSSPTFPEAPEGLPTYCNPSEMEEISLQICQDKCAPAECCWNTQVEACSNELCQGYARPCAILNDLQTYPGTTGADVATQQGNNDDNTDDNDNADDNQVPEAAADLADRCSRSAITNSEDGGTLLIACEQECLQASCCWQPNASVTCSDNDRCAAYQEPCSMFLGLFSSPSSSSSGSSSSSTTDAPASTTATEEEPTDISSVPAAPSNLQDVCAVDQLKPDVDNGASIVQCEKECLVAACCWKENHPIICPEATQCSDYMEPCGQNLVQALLALETGSTSSNTGSGTTTTPTTTEDGDDVSVVQSNDISAACDTNGVIFQKARCEEVCTPGSCCFDDSTACDVDVHCGLYEPCQVLNRRRTMLRH